MSVGRLKTPAVCRRSSNNKCDTVLAQFKRFLSISPWVFAHITYSSSNCTDLIWGHGGDQAPPFGGSRALHFGEQRAGTESPPTSQYRHSHEASECLYWLLGIDTNPRDTHPSMLTAPRPPGARVPNCTLTSPPSALNAAPNLIKVGLFSFKRHHTHELL